MMMFENTKRDKYDVLRGSIICIEGLVGVGKSTAGKSMSAHLNSLGVTTKYFPEYVNSHLLKQYLSNMKLYAYYFQMFMLLKRIDSYKEAIRYAKKGGISIIDRCLVGDYAFAHMQYVKGYISGKDWEVYKSVMEEEKLRTPDIILYLKCDPGIAFKRMKYRNNHSEVNGYNLQYFEDLQVSYNNTMSNIDNDLIVNVDWDTNKKVSNEGLENITSEYLLNICRDKIIS
jgi:deoxyadenosine/deoxycytidine kinase